MEQPEQHEVSSQDVHGVYTLADIDTFTFGDIERSKNKILTELSGLELDTASLRLKDLFVLMRTMMEKYFDRDHIEKERVFVQGDASDHAKTGYSFYELMDVVAKAHSMDVLRRVVELAYIDYNKVMKPVFSIPTVRTDAKKNL